MFGGNILITMNSFSDICGCQEVDGSAIFVGVRYTYIFINTVEITETTKRNHVDFFLKPTNSYSKDYFKISDKLLLPFILNHPTLGVITLNRTGVKIVGNTYTNISMGVDRMQNGLLVNGGLISLINVPSITFERETF
jgi:hypothetical protein